MTESRKIFKYELTGNDTRPDGSIALSLPRGARILSVGAQGSGLFLWAIVSPWCSKETRVFHVIGTGHDLPDEVDLSRSDCAFLGTVIMLDGALVLHVFEHKEPTQ